MKSRRIRILATAAFGLFAMCVFAKTAAAQDALRGSFTLPNEVRWQSAVLPAGDYTFSIKSIDMTAPIKVQGPGGGAFIFVMAFSMRHTDRPSELIIQRRDESRYVRELYLVDLDLHLQYWVPKAPKEELLAQGPVTTERIPISSAGK